MAAILSTSFAAPVTDWAASWSLASVTGVQVGHLCVTESELAQVTKVGPGTTVAVRRGVEATRSAAHATGTPVAIFRADQLPTAAVATTAPPVRQVTVTLSHAQFLALNTTPQTLIPAPGPNKLLIPIRVDLWTHFTAAYTGLGTSDELFVDHGAGGGGTLLVNTASHNKLSTFVETLADHLAQLIVPQAMFNSEYGVDMPAIQPTLSGIVNYPLTLNASWSLTGGHVNNTVTAVALYYIVDVTTGVFI